MIGLLFIAILAFVGGWFAWLYFVSPKSDRARIEADQGGTGVRVVSVERIGTQHDRGAVLWVADRPLLGAGAWFRVYRVTLVPPSGVAETHTVGVEARMFGLSDLKNLDQRA